MARKLSVNLALAALVALVPAGAAWAVTIQLLGYNGNSVIYQEWYGATDSGLKPGAAGGALEGAYPELTSSDFVWKIARLTNPSSGTIIQEDENSITYKVTYNSLVTGQGIGGEGSQIRFKLTIGSFTIISDDLVVETVAKYMRTTQGDGTWYVYEGEIMKGSGTIFGSNLPFTFTGSLYPVNMNSSMHNGYITDFTLSYSAVPLPAAVWLLGTGLLGLACLGWRRRS